MAVNIPKHGSTSFVCILALSTSIAEGLVKFESHAAHGSEIALRISRTIRRRASNLDPEEIGPGVDDQVVADVALEGKRYSDFQRFFNLICVPARESVKLS